MNAASPQLRAFQARAPVLTPQQRLNSAWVAAGLGVFSSQSMVDLYSAIYDSTDPDDLPSTDAWQLRQAFVGKDADTRLAAIRHLLAVGKDPLQKEAMRALVARAASRIEPDPKLQADAPDLISAMLAAGYDQAAARWVGACSRMKDEAHDRCWAMLVLAAPNTSGLDLSAGRITSFIGRDKSRNRIRSALLVAGLAGTRPNHTRCSQFAQSALRPRLGPAVELDQDDRRRRGPPTGGNRACAHGHGIPNNQVGRGARSARVSCAHGARADRAGFHGANGRCRGLVTDVTLRTEPRT